MPIAPKKTAATAASQKITAWSFSRLNDYRRCPKLAFYKHVKKLREPSNPAMERGSNIHEQAQVFAQKTSKVKCPAELECFEQEFRVLQKNKTSLAVEQQWCVTKDWTGTGWFDADAWCRVIVDARYLRKEDNVLVVIDHKTGKLNPDHLEQLSIYALLGLILNPDIAGVEVQLWYLDHGVQWPEKPTIYTHKDIPALKKEWATKIKPMLADTVFREKPGKNCTWCFFSKAKGGPCKY